VWQTNHAADLFLRQSFRRIRRFLSDLNDKDDKALLATANAALEQGRASSGDPLSSAVFSRTDCAVSHKTAAEASFLKERLGGWPPAVNRRCRDKARQGRRTTAPDLSKDSSDGAVSAPLSCFAFEWGIWTLAMLSQARQKPPFPIIRFSRKPAIAI
jgi:hypothetical protein